MTKEFTITDDLLASQGQRFLNYIIDFIVQMSIAVIFLIIIGIVLSLLGIEGIEERLDNTNRFEDFLLGIIITFLYYLPFESLNSRTIGKLITGTIVVMEDGTKPNSTEILKRTMWRIIPFNALTFLGSPSRGWHDSKSDTYVVVKKDFDAKLELHNSFESIGKETI